MKSQDKKKQINSTEECVASAKPTPVPFQCPIVAMGASAGGLEVFQQFFDRMPCGTGMAFVLVQHLDPKHDTLMPELLSKHTSMKVVRMMDGLKIEADHVYVLPPNTFLKAEGCTFRTGYISPTTDRRLIDHVFRSLAEDHKESVLGIILSGTGFDGTLGLRAIKEHGGMTIAQAPDTAKFDSMPRHAISTGFVDSVLTVEEMPDRIVEYVKHLAKLYHRKGAATIQQEALNYLPDIFLILRGATGHDFSRYKQSTLVRRIQRRMQVVYLESVAEYVKYLGTSPAEVEALFKDLLIGVTLFFRDSESFQMMEKKVIAPLFENKAPGSQIRVWVPGCASGEEAYSFAILLTEAAEKTGGELKIQVFATDLDVESLDYARKGRYPEEIEQQVSEARLKRFFRKRGSTYEVIDEIREMCVFSPHNLIKDPPFSRLDLISCRNLLIYFEADLQKKLLPLFHFALNPSGYLFLGPSENIASRSELFRVVDQKHRLFQRKPSLLHVPAQLPIMDRGNVTRLQSLTATTLSLPKEQNFSRSIERIILEEYAPASAVINDQGEVLYFSGNTGTFLEPPAGVPSNKIVAMARKSLRLELRTLVHRAVSTGQEAIRENIRVKLGSKIQQIDMIVRPLIELGNEQPLYIVLFRELIPSPNAGTPVSEDFASHEHPVIKQLETELRSTKDDLQTTIEELETSNEELKSANEELLSMNEELQSANEELQTSKEEVQSANDELHRKIEELESTSNELRRAHEDRAKLAAIVQNSEDAIISKALDGTITSWNKAAERIFGYRADEIIGKPITTIIPADKQDEEVHILERLRNGERIQHYETARVAKSGRRILVSLTLSPIRDADGFVMGASKIARDITDRKKADEARYRLGALVESSDDAIITKTLDGIITSWNKAAMRIFGYSAEETIGKPITILIPPEREDEEPAILSRLRRGERIDHYETKRRRKDGTIIDVSLTVSPIKDVKGHTIGASKIARDITDKKRWEMELKRAKEELEERVQERTASLQETTEQLETFCYSIAHDLRSPLRAQQSFAQVLLEDYKTVLDQAGIDYARRIIHNAERLDNLVNDLLSYARLSRDELKFDPIDLSKVVEEVQNALSDTIQKQNACVSVGTLDSVMGYEPTLNLVISNLVSNALKFVAPGQSAKIHIWSERRDGMVRTWVEDNGIGISRENAAKIFGVFQRLHAIGKYPGTGIGLAIVHKGTERMGGKVGVESCPGKGSRFWIDLPAAN